MLMGCLLEGKTASMKVPPKRKGNVKRNDDAYIDGETASMKVPPKRKGNSHGMPTDAEAPSGLNESPSEKEGKSIEVPEQL